MLRVNGFYGHVRRNDLRSVVLFVGFLVALQLIAVVALALPLLLVDYRHSPIFFPQAYAARYPLIVLALGVLLFAVRFLRHVASVEARVRFVRVDRRTEPRLVNKVETLAIAAGLPLPDVGLIENAACNALACGLSPSSAFVVVTRGLLDALDDRELDAVLAHEIAHIRNGDIRLMAAANVTLEILLGLQRLNVLRISNRRRAVFAFVIPGYLILAFVGGAMSHGALILARVSRLLIASSREFIADAEAVRLTHNPEALISALRRIEGHSAIPWLSLAEDAMMIDGLVSGPFANHPPIAERIAVLARLSSASTLCGRRDIRAAFGTRSAPTSALHAPSPSLVMRVSEGTDEDLFGLSTGARRVILVGLALGFALSCLAQSMAPLFGPMLEKRMEDRFLEAMNKQDTRLRDESAYRTMLTQRSVLSSPRLVQSDGCSMANRGSADSASLYDRMTWRLFMIVQSVQAWLTSGQGPFPQSDYQRTVDRLGGIPCQPASQDVRFGSR